MTSNIRGPSSRRGAWIGAVAAMVLLSTVSISVPRAAAQATKNPDPKRYIEILDNAFRFVLQNYVEELDPKKLYEGAMKGMFEALEDPYSVFLDEAMLSDMTDVTSGEFGGVGLYISKQAVDPKKPEDAPRYIEVVSPIEDTPGWRFGILAGDLIVKIDGENTAPLSTDEAQNRIRGKPGSTVVLTLRRDSAEFDAAIVRARIEIPTVKKALITTPTGDVAYIRIIDFTPQTKPRVEEALKDFATSGYRALVIDVRNNPGGLLQSVIQVSDLFLESGIIVSTKGRNPYENSVSRAKPDLAVPKDRPIVLLLNRGSASASEILAGALKDNKRAYLIGENSYGKGSVQQIYPIDSTGFKLTTSRYYTPSDENIDKTGIPPDLEAKDAELSETESEALQKLLESGRIPEIAAAWQGMDDAAHEAAVKESGLSDRLFRKLVRDEITRKAPRPPVYDLEYDVVLQAAVATLDRPDYASLLQGARTVKELVAAKKAAEEAAEKPGESAEGSAALGTEAAPSGEKK